MNRGRRSWLRRRLRLTELGGALVWPGLIGLLGALTTAGFRQAMRGVEYAMTGQTGSFVAAAMALDPLTRFLVPTLGGCLAGLVLQYGMALAPARRTTDYMEAVAVGSGFLSVRASLVKSASSLLSIGSGGSIGREGAMVQLAALVGSLFGRLLAFPAPSRRLLVACGAAAGLASAYNAPLAAVVFVAEIVLRDLRLESLGPLIVSAVVAGAAMHQFLGFAPVYEVPEFRLVSPVELVFYVVLGIAAGHLATFFLWMLRRSGAFFRSLGLPLWLQLGGGGLVVGTLSVLEPRVWGNGYSVVNAVLKEPWTWQALLAILAFKMLATSAMAGSGAVGGVFTPSIFCGAALGALVGTGVHELLPGLGGTPGAYAVVGMSAFLTGTTHAPLMSILMIFEMTRQYEVLLPLMLASIVAHYVAKVYRKGRSIYAPALERRRDSGPDEPPRAP